MIIRSIFYKTCPNLEDDKTQGTARRSIRILPFNHVCYSRSLHERISVLIIVDDVNFIRWFYPRNGRRVSAVCSASQNARLCGYPAICDYIYMPLRMVSLTLSENAASSLFALVPLALPFCVRGAFAAACIGWGAAATSNRRRKHQCNTSMIQNIHEKKKRIKETYIRTQEHKDANCDVHIPQPSFGHQQQHHCPFMAFVVLLWCWPSKNQLLCAHIKIHIIS